MNISSGGSLTNKSISSKASLSIISSASLTSTAIATKNNSLSKSSSRNQKDYKFLDIKELLDRGAEVNVKDDDGYTPLHHAAAGNSVNSVIMLLERGAHINAVTNVSIAYISGIPYAIYYVCPYPFLLKCRRVGDLCI